MRSDGSFAREWLTILCVMQVAKEMTFDRWMEIVGLIVALVWPGVWPILQAKYQQRSRKSMELALYDLERPGFRERQEAISRLRLSKAAAYSATALICLGLQLVNHGFLAAYGAVLAGGLAAFEAARAALSSAYTHEDYTLMVRRNYRQKLGLPVPTRDGEVPRFIGLKEATDPDEH